MSRLKLKRNGKILLTLLLGLALTAALVFTAVRTILPSGQSAKAASQTFALNRPNSTSDIQVVGWSATNNSKPHEYITDQFDEGYAPRSALLTSGTYVAGNTRTVKTVNWWELSAQSDKAAYLRHTSRIFTLYNGAGKNLFSNSEGSGGDQLAMSSGNGTQLKIDDNSGETQTAAGRFEMVWWNDIVIPEGSIGVYDFNVAINLANTQVVSSTKGADKTATYNFFAISYSDGTPGSIHATGSNFLEKTNESNKFIFITDDANHKAGDANAKITIPTLSNVDLSQTKFLRVGVYLSGWIRWQHCPVVEEFSYTEKSGAASSNFSLNQPGAVDRNHIVVNTQSSGFTATSGNPAGNASDYVPSSTFGEGGTNPAGQWGKTVLWSTLMSQSDKAAYLRNPTRINGLYNGSSGAFLNSQMRDVTLNTQGKATNTTGYNDNGYDQSLKIDGSSNVNNNPPEMIWWTDIAIPDGTTGSYDFTFAINTASVQGKGDLKYNFFAIAYSAGGAGRLGGNGELVQLAQANNYLYVSDGTNREGTGYKYPIPTLKGINLAKTKFIRVGVYVKGGLNWHHTPVIQEFTYTQQAEPTVYQTIDSVAKLEALRNAVNLGYDQYGKTFTLTKDLELTGNWTPIGELTDTNFVGANGTTRGVGFAGMFDGGGHKITFSQSTVFATGLFGVITSDGTVENLAVDGSSNFNNSGASRTNGNGTVASWCYGTIRNVVNYGVNLGTNSSTRIKGASGGIVGYLRPGGTVENAVNFGNVYCTENSGGIPNVHNGVAAGGIVGIAANSTVQKVANYGYITIWEYTNSGGNAGGIVGIVRRSGSSGKVTISHAYHYGTAHSYSLAGAIVGYSGETVHEIRYAYRGGTSIVNSSTNSNIVGGGSTGIYTSTTAYNSKQTSIPSTWSADDWAVDSGINAGGIYLKVLHNLLMGQFGTHTTNTTKIVSLSVTMPTTFEFEYSYGVNRKAEVTPTVNVQWTVSDTVRDAYTGGGTPEFYSMAIAKGSNSNLQVIENLGVYSVTVSYQYGCYNFPEFGTSYTAYDVTIFPRSHISSPQNLNTLRTAVNQEGMDLRGRTFYLDNDIDLSTVTTTQNWTPIGPLTADNYSNASANGSVGFAGIFDGQGHTIRGFYQSGAFATGLFGVIKEGGKILNLAIDGTTLYNSSTVVSGNGVFASWCFGEIKDVVNFGVDIGTEASRANGSAGGIVGYLGANGSITNAVNFGDIYYCQNNYESSKVLPGTTDIRGLDGGGIVGLMVGGGSSVSNVANYGTVSSGDRGGRAGGIVGAIVGGSVSYAYNYGAVVSSNNYAGGIVAYGQSGSTNTLDYVYNEGTPQSSKESWTGAIAGAGTGNFTVGVSSGTKPTATNGTWTSAKWAQDDNINAGGIYLIALHDMLMEKFHMVTAAAEVNDCGYVANGTDWTQSALNDAFTVSEFPNWVSDAVKEKYTQLSTEPVYGTLTLNGQPLGNLTEGGVYGVAAKYAYGTQIFAEGNINIYIVKTDIETVTDLAILRDAVNAGFDQSDITFQLTSDLNMGSVDWRPIGEVAAANLADAKIGKVGFAGTFDGNNHILTNFKQTALSNAFVTGLFGVVKTGGTVEKLAISSAANTYLGNTNSNLANGNGVVAAWNFGTIRNVVNYGVNVGTDTARVAGAAGGIVGFLGDGGTIENAANFGNVYATGNTLVAATLPGTTQYAGAAVGGIAGATANGTITGVANYGTVNMPTSYARAGGIVGSVANGSVSFAYNYGAITGTAFVGGIAGGYEDGYTYSITNVYQAGTVAGTTTREINGRGTDAQTTAPISKTKLTALTADWDSEKWGLDAGINNGGAYLKELHQTLITLGMITWNVTEVTGNLETQYTGADFASGLAEERFTVHALEWVSTTVKTLYTQGATPKFAKLTEITVGGQAVEEIVNAGEYSVTAEYGYGSFLFKGPNSFTYEVTKVQLSSGKWMLGAEVLGALRGTYTGEVQDIRYDLGLAEGSASIVYSYTLQSVDVFQEGKPTDAGAYYVRAEITGIDWSNFEGEATVETEYTVDRKIVEITWNDVAYGEDGIGVISKVYNGEAQEPTYSYDGICSVDAGEVTPQLVYAASGQGVGEFVNVCQFFLTVGFDGEKGSNYTVSDQSSVRFEIMKRALHVSWEGLTDGKVVHEFDGEYVLPTPIYKDAEDNEVDLFTGEYPVFWDGTGNYTTEGWRNATAASGVTLTLYIAKNAGDVMGLSPNYDLQGDPQVTFVISPKTVTGTWSQASFEYNGEQQTPEFRFADGTVEGSDVVTPVYAYSQKDDADNYVRIGAAPVNAGSYRVAVGLEGRNAGNYVVSESLEEQDFVIDKKKYQLRILPLSDTSMGVTQNTVGTGGDWKVNRRVTRFVYPEVAINLTVTGTQLTLVWCSNGDFSQRNESTVAPYDEMDGETFTRYSWRLPSEDDVTSVTFWFELPASIAQNYETEDGEPEKQTILLKRALTYTLSNVEWTYGDGEKITVEGEDYYVSTTRGNLEYSDGWTATVADDTVIPYYEFVRGTGEEANTEWMQLAIGKAGSTTLTLTHAESEKYLSTTQTVTVTYRPKNVQFNAIDLRGSYGEKTYTAQDFFLAPALAYDDTVANTFNISSNYNGATMKDVKRGTNGETEAYAITVTIGENSNYTLNGQTGDLTLNATLTVLPKALTVYAGNDYEAYYGYASLPAMNFTYDGFIDGEDETNAADFVAPTADYPQPEAGKAFLDVKRYEFELTGGSARNYRFTLIGGSLTIRKVNLTGVTGAKVGTVYNASAQRYNGDISVSVPAGGTPIQEGYSYAVTGYYQNGNEVTPVNAGTYDVAITVYTTATDNYANYDATLQGVFVIGKVTPFLNPTVSTGFVYNGEVQRGVIADWGLTGGTGTGGVEYIYYYENETTPTNPIHAGTYKVTVAYVPGENDNYFENSTEVSFVIDKANMRIGFDTVNTPYDAKTHEIQNLVVRGVGTHGDILEADITDKVNFNVVYRQGGRVLSDFPKNAGMYVVEVTATPKAGAFTYPDYEVTSVRTESAVVITQVQIKEIKFEASKVDYDGTNKEPLKPAVAIGVEGDEPQGTFRYDFRRIGDTIYTAYARGAGKYDVRVTYLPVAGDNYTAGDPVEFIGTEESPFFEILRAPVTIRLNRVDNNFTGERFPVTAVLNSTVAGEEPKGDVTYQYYYYDGENKVEMGDTAPRNAGTYGVTVTYSAVTNDNFLSHTEDFDGYIVIRPIAPGISLVSAIHNFDGTPKGANEATLRGGAADTDGPKQTSLTYLYYVQGSWTSEYPVEVGRYNVNVRYSPAEGEVNYIETDRTFNEGVIIDKRRPTIELEAKTVKYDGNGVLPNAAVIGDGTSAKGVVTYEYAQSTTWSVSVPVNVGTYSVRVIYRATADDNYASEVKEFRDHLVIEPADLEITPVIGQYKVYDGQPISEIQFNRPQLALGNQWQGELYAPGVDEGEYEISIGTLTAGRNYNIKFTTGVKYRIEKRTVYFNFSDINPVYDGKYKQVSVSCEGVLDGEDPLCIVSYEGDRMNVGTFTAIASVHGKNYRASANNFREYAVTPASMGEIPFADSTVRYDGKPHSILVYAAPDGSKVTYESAHTFTEIGAYIIRAKVTKPNYYDVDLRATLVIEKGASRVSVSIPTGPYRYGDALPQLTAVGDPGVATLDEGQTLVPGELDYTWTFTPLDSAHYETVKGTIQIRVVKATADISLKGSLRQEENNLHALVTSVPEQLQGEVQVVYIDSKGTEYKTAPTEAGNYIVRVTYAGDDYYESVSFDKQLVITEKSSMAWILYVVIGIVVLAAASGIFFNTKRKIK